MDEAIEQALKGLVQALQESDIGTVRRLTVDLQASGEHPYQVTTAEEELPLPGLVNV